MQDYVSLHTHSAYSFLDGFRSVADYVRIVQEMGQGALGLTDHGNVMGLYSLITECQKAGIKPIPGCEFYMSPQNPEGAKARYPVYYAHGGSHDVSRNGAYTHMTVWAITNQGLRNLYALSTLSYQPEHVYHQPRIDINMLIEHADGLVVATGCPSSEVSTRFRLDQDEQAYNYVRRLKEVFGDRLFVEVMNHEMTSELERSLLRKQLQLASDLDIELLATNDAHYGLQDDAGHHEEMCAAGTGSVMSEATYSNGGSRFALDGNQYYLKTTEEMQRMFPEEYYPRAVSNTRRIAEMTEDFHLSYDPTLIPKPHVPEGMTENQYFAQLVKEGFRQRYGNESSDVQRMAKETVEKEMQVFVSLGYVGYMLIVQEYLSWIRDNYSTLDQEGNVIALPQGIGRGSGPGSIISYVLYISHLDPIRYGLIFERFLSPGRGSIYQVTYDDGTTDKFVASDQVSVVTAEGTTRTKYAHQIQSQDAVVQDSE